MGDGGFQSPNPPSGLHGDEYFYSGVVPLTCTNAPPDLLGISVGSYGSGDFEGTNMEAVMSLYNDGSGRFRRGAMYSLQRDFASWLAVGDFNGDCIENVIVDGVETCDGGPGMGVLFGDGDGGFLPALRLNAPGPGAATLALIGAVSSPRAICASAPLRHRHYRAWRCQQGVVEGRALGDASQD